MIDFLVMAFFLAPPSPVVAATGTTPSASQAPVTTPASGKVPAAAPPSSPAPASGALGATNYRDPVQISAQLVTGDRKQSILTGDVQVKHRTLDLRCDKMIAYYTQPQEVTRVVCTGNVRAVDGDRTARGDRADYDVPTGVLVVTGSPEARQGTTYVTGTKVRLTLGSERLEVENARILVESQAGAPLGGRKRGSPPPTAGTPPQGGGSK
ncbi:hypothetical protein JGU66_11205 [Myxococcaceae bacterium JPH2]|nr:hypothetical protein [Myxococcaceae bacterium JPH2]